MNKAFTRESDYDPALDVVARPHPELPDGTRNYITPDGAARMRAELAELQEQVLPALRRKVAELVAADRRGDPAYQDARRGVAQAEQQAAWLEERIATLEVVEPVADAERVRFGARVTVLDAEERERVWEIVGIDETDPGAGRLSWMSPIARALLTREVGDEVAVTLPNGKTTLEILAIEAAGTPGDGAS